jgi:hypothetical protein
VGDDGVAELVLDVARADAAHTPIGPG